MASKDCKLQNPNPLAETPYGSPMMDWTDWSHTANSPGSISKIDFTNADLYGKQMTFENKIKTLIGFFLINKQKKTRLFY